MSTTSVLARCGGGRAGPAPIVRALGGLVRSSALQLARLALALAAACSPCFAQDLDSLACGMVGDSLFVGFSLPVRSLRAAKLETALDDQGLSVECDVSVEVRKKEGLFNKTVVKALYRRALSYSRWYDEYVLSENAREVATSKSYFTALDRFRRFTRLKVADMGTLDSGQDYLVRLEVALVPRVPSRPAGGPGAGRLSGVRGRAPRGAGAGPGDADRPVEAGLGLPREMLELFKGKGSLLSIRIESAIFRPMEVPRWVSRAIPDELRAARVP